MAVNPIPTGMRNINISLTVSPCAEAINFYVKAFGATVVDQMTGPDGLVAHAEIRIGDSVIMMSDEWPTAPTKSPKTLGGSTAAVFLYFDDIDALWDRAVAAGCTIHYPLETQFYGDRGGRLIDPFGHSWGLGQHVEDVSPEELEVRMAKFYEDQAPSEA